ncbi:Sua5/YciO/YrdC/YwlC family protein, partial [Bacillus pumilus]|uniref:Sua5/YciO/YrdC/YwlC family protein n=1 Tax=Bacillus pumilus TaxID=1408 RepID=UPI0034D953D9
MKIYQPKAPPTHNPFILHIPHLHHLHQFPQIQTQTPNPFIKPFSPPALTILLPSNLATLSNHLTPPLSTL